MEKRIHLNTLLDIMIIDRNVITMSLRVSNNKKLLKHFNKMWEKVGKLMKINSESKPVYGDDVYLKRG